MMTTMAVAVRLFSMICYTEWQEEANVMGTKRKPEQQSAFPLASLHPASTPSSTTARFVVCLRHSIHSLLLKSFVELTFHSLALD